jgi:hypothetical protein
VTDTVYVPPGVPLAVEMVSVAVADPAPVKVTAFELKEQLGLEVDAADFSSSHERVTVPE